MKNIVENRIVVYCKSPASPSPLFLLFNNEKNNSRDFYSILVLIVATSNWLLTADSTQFEFSKARTGRRDIDPQLAGLRENGQL